MHLYLDFENGPPSWWSYDSFFGGNVEREDDSYIWVVANIDSFPRRFKLQKSCSLTDLSVGTGLCLHLATSSIDTCEQCQAWEV